MSISSSPATGSRCVASSFPMKGPFRPFGCRRCTACLTDALLATCGAGDIGDHFPPSDPQWKGAPSCIFLERAAEIVRERGGTITNADVSIIAERPKVGPHRETMRANMSEFLNISIDRCSVKATTNETIGFVGREEGIAAIATATVIYEGGRS